MKELLMRILFNKPVPKKDVVNILDFGASTVEKFDNTKAFTDADIECAKTGSDLYIPSGTYDFKSKIKFEGNYSINCKGHLRYYMQESLGSFITVGNALKQYSGNTFFFATVSSIQWVPTIRDFAAIEFLNISNSKIDVMVAASAGTGILFRGVGDGYTSFNTVRLPLVWGCLDGIRLTCEKPSFVNQNTFIDGGVYAPQSKGGRGIVIDGYNCNSNLFIHTSIEMAENCDWGIYCDIGAAANTFRDIRNENNGDGTKPFAFFDGIDTRENKIYPQFEGLAKNTGVQSTNPTNKYIVE